MTTSPPLLKPLQDTPEVRAYVSTLQDIHGFMVRTMEEHGAQFTNDGALRANANFDCVPFNGGVAIRFGASKNPYPDSLITGLGKVDFGSRLYNPEAGKKIFDILAEKLGLELAIEAPEKRRAQGDAGPVYVVTKDLNGNPLPKPDLTHITASTHTDHTVVYFKDDFTGYRPFIDQMYALWDRIAPPSPKKPETVVTSAPGNGPGVGSGWGRVASVILPKSVRSLVARLRPSKVRKAEPAQAATAQRG